MGTEFSAGWFTETFSPDQVHRHRFTRTLLRTRTPFQEAIVADSPTYGRCLILDGEMQSAARDEFIYHESLVQPAMVAHGGARDVLILGGGEGATAREVLRHAGVRRVTMVDLDEAVLQFSRRHLSQWHQGAFAHAKTRLVVGDAGHFVDTTRDQFDVIIADLPTPSESGPLLRLYSVEFYRSILRRLRPGGLFVTQAGSASPVQMRFFAVLARTLSRVFRLVRPATAFVPSFDVPWGFLTGAQTLDPWALSAPQVDRRLGSLRGRLRFYDGQAHLGLFHTPKYVRERIIREKAIVKDGTRFYG